MNLISSWSGGKDSCYALMLALAQGNELKVLLNMMNENGLISRSHGLPSFLLEQQAKSMGVPLITVPATWEEYEQKYIQALKQLRNDFKAHAVVFGDIDLEAHREWEQKVCKASEVKPFLPLWLADRKKIVVEMIDSGIESMIVSCNAQMGQSFLGKTITKNLIEELEDMGIDACGENGEYHTLVFDCPLFNQALKLPNYSKTTHNNYCFIVWDL